MRRSWFWLEAVVADDERALLTRNGRFERILAPGRHRYFDPGREYAIEVVKAHRSEFPYDRALLIAATHPEVAREYFEIQRADTHVAVIVYFDGVAKGILPPMSTRAYWKTTTRVEFTLVDTRATLRVEPRILDQIDVPRSTLVSDHEIGAHEIGLLFVDGELTERLPPGRHAFWKATRKIAVQKFDLRPQPVEVTAQELLTKDRIGLRVTLTAFYRIVDPEKAMRGATDLQTALYRLIQFAVREAIATRTLDEILAARDRIDAEVRAYVGERAGELGVETTELGVKDVILPGDVRELVNKVVEAERVAKANLIRRQEETAATRSLLNTAKLMQENPLLVRLKELEALEKLVEKVGRIDLHATGQGGGLEALLQNLWRMGKEERAAQ